MAIQITYDSKTIDLIMAERALEPNYLHDYRRNMAGNGAAETINLHGFQEHTFQLYFTESTYEDLIAWWSWARQGNPWSFAFDSNKAVETTLSMAASADEVLINLIQTAGFSSGDVCFIQSVRDDKYEIVTIDTVGVGDVYIVDADGTYIVDADGTYLVSREAGTGVSITTALKFSYDAGDYFRHWNYWPEVFSLDTDFKPLKNGDYYKHLIRFAVLN